jgi:transposase
MRPKDPGRVPVQAAPRLGLLSARSRRRLALFGRQFRDRSIARRRAGVDLHLIADNYATHKHPKVRAWLDKRPRFKMHFTPTSSPWLNLAERFFADLTGDVIRAGSFASVNELARDINAYLAHRNAAPKPYVWRPEGAETLAKIKRARAALHKAAAA